MAHVEDRDLGYNKIINSIKDLNGAEVVVGVLRNAGKEKDGTDLVDVAVYNEYGTKHIPSRPFLRIATDKHGGEWQDLIEDCYDSVMAGRMSKNIVLQQVGNKAVGDIQKTITRSSNFKPNSPATVEKKGSSAPLIDTGRLRQSIRFRIEK